MSDSELEAKLAEIRETATRLVGETPVTVSAVLLKDIFGLLDWLTDFSTWSERMTHKIYFCRFCQAAGSWPADIKHTDKCHIPHATSLLNTVRSVINSREEMR